MATGVEWWVLTIKTDFLTGFYVTRVVSGSVVVIYTLDVTGWAIEVVFTVHTGFVIKSV